MARIPAAAVAIFLALGPGALLSAGQDGGADALLRPGLGADVLARTISWDDDARESKLNAVLATVRGDFRLAEGFVVGLFAGYGTTNPNGLVFRGLPFSIDYEAGGIGAILAGADLRKTLFRAGDFEIGLRAGYQRSFASKSALEITTLNQAGTAEAESSWHRATAGAFVRYLGYEKFSPFVVLAFDKLWGKFTMTEAIAELEGTETKSIAGKGLFGLTLGTDFEPAPGIRLSGEVTAVPFKRLAGGLDMDYGIALRAGFGI